MTSSDWIAIAAFVVALLSFFRDQIWRRKDEEGSAIDTNIQQQIREIQDRMLAIEESKNVDAKLRADAASKPNIAAFYRNRKLILRNTGGSTALDVRYRLADNCTSGQPFPNEHQGCSIGVGQIQDMPLIQNGMTESLPFDMVLEWTDDTGATYHETQPLNG